MYVLDFFCVCLSEDGFLKRFLLMATGSVCNSFWMLGNRSSLGSWFAISPLLLSLEVEIIGVLTGSSIGSCLMLGLALISIDLNLPKMRRRDIKSSSSFSDALMPMVTYIHSFGNLYGTPQETAPSPMTWIKISFK